MTLITDFSSDDICIAITELTTKGCIVSSDKHITYLDTTEELLEEIVLNKLIENQNKKPFNALRKIRDTKLQSTDKYVLPDYPITEEKRNEIINYRNLLRNLPETLQNQTLDIGNLYQYLPSEPV